MTDEQQADFPQELVEALEKLDISDFDWDRDVSVDDLLYLVKQCPFLQMVGIGDVEPLAEPQFITAQSGWVIHHYGDAISSSPGKLLFAGGDFRALLAEEDDGDDGGIINPGKGTIVKQAFDTAAEMIALAQQLGWQGAKLIDGHPLMYWAAWMQASDDGFTLEGYEPTEEDRQKRKRVKRSEVEDQLQVRRRPTTR